MSLALTVRRVAAAFIAAAALGALGSASIASAQTYTVFEQTFTRDTGAPVAVEAPVVPPNPGRFKIRIASAGAASALIRMNGTAIAVPNEFSSSPQTIERSVTLLATNTLSVEVRGAPGGTVRVTIFAEDRVRPVVRALASPPPNAQGWNTTDVVVTFECSDAASGVVSCPAPVTVTTEGANQVVSGTATDAAGNTGTARVTVNIDKTPPSISGSISPAANTYGWNNSDVRVWFECVENLSRLAECTSPVAIIARGNEGQHDVAGVARDRAGHTATTSVRVNVDVTAPTIVATPDRPPDDGSWYTSPVTVSFACADDRAGIAVCPEPVRVTANGSNIAVPGTATDRAGNRASTQLFVNMRAGTSAPTIEAAVSPAPNAAGWNNTDPTVTFTCTATGAAIQVCPPPQVVTTEGVHEISGTVIDVNGSQRTTTVTVRLDRTPPSITPAVQPAANDAGWHRTPATVTFACADSGSGVSTCPSPATVSADGAAQAVNGTASDQAGNTASASINVSMDSTPPSIRAIAGPPDASSGYAVTVSFECSDTTSGIAVCPAPIVVTEGTNQLISGTAVDVAGNTAVGSVSVTIDRTRPEIVATISPLPNAAGWHNGPVTVTFTCTANGSPIVSCPAPVTVTANGNGQVISGEAIDAAGGRSQTSVTLNIDTIPPVIAATPSRPANQYGWHNAPVTVAFECTDALSSIVGCSPAVDIASDGERTVSGTATDAAGNEASASITIRLDQVPPVATSSVNPPANAAQWHNADVTVSFECSDSGAGVLDCPAAFVVNSEGADQPIARVVSDRAGNTTPVTTTVSLDRTPPSIVIQGIAENAVVQSTPLRLVAQLSDALSGVVTAMCGTSAVAVGPTLECERALTPGLNTFVLRATDGAGNETQVTRNVRFEANRDPRAMPGGPYAGVTGSPITFSATASFDPDGHPLTYAWRFGDGATGTGPQPTHSYTTAGSFTVTLTVNDGNGGVHEATTTAAVARANEVPVARVAAQYTVDVGSSVRFDATASTDADGDPLSAEWSFGDGGSGTGLTPEYTYRTVGTFSAVVTVSDGRGGTATATASVTVRTVNQPPMARAGGPYRGEVGRPIAFDASASSDPDQDPVTFEWTFGDGNRASGASASHVFAAVGMFPVTVTVTDARGASSSASTQVTVDATNSVPIARANGPYTQEQGFAVALSSTGSIDPDGDVLTFTWRFGDGRSSTAASPSPLYVTPGTYTAELTVSDGRGGVATDAATVVITPRATQENRNPSAAAGGPYEVEAGVPLVLNGAASFDPDGDALQFAWNFGDGQTSSDRSPTYAWAQPGTFAVTLAVSDGRGGSASAATQVTVTTAADRAPPILTLIAPAEVLPGTQVRVSAQVADASPIASVRFTFGDTQSPADAEPPFEQLIDVPAVAAPGATLVVRAAAIDAAGNTGTAEIAMTIAAQPDNQPPTISLNRPEQLSPGQTLHLSADAADNAGVKEVFFRVNDVDLGVDTAPPFAAVYLVPADAAIGAVLRVTARAVDFTGNDAEAAADVAIVGTTDTTPPNVGLSAPSTASPGSLVQAIATASDNSGLSMVRVTLNGVTIAERTSAPFTVDIPVPAAAANGSLLRIQASATDYAGLSAETTTTLRVVVLTAADDGLVVGEVYDEDSGGPVAGAQVRISGRTTGGVTFVTETETDARGRYALRAPAGSGVIAISRPGWTRAERVVVLASGQVQTAIDARIGILAGAQVISPVLGSSVAAGDSTIVFPPGAVTQPLELRTRRLSAQGLRSPLPIGWSPLAAVDLTPAGVALAEAASWQVQLPAGITAGRDVHLVAWDESGSGWIAVESQTASPAIASAITRTGQYAIVIGDIEPAAPPAPAPGSVLLGAPQVALPPDVVAALTPQPRVLVYEPGARSQVTTEIPATTPLPSGTMLQAAIQESYWFMDGSTLRLDPFAQDLFFHQLPDAATRLRAIYPVSSLLQAEALTLREGVIDVSIREANAGATAPAISEQGGTVSGPDGSRLEIPPGALQQLASVSMQAIAADALGAALPEAVSFVAGADLLMTATLDRSAILSVPRPDGIDSSSTLLLVRVVDVAGVSRIVLTALGRVDGDRITTELELPRNGIALPGIREGGRYAFVATSTPAAFAFGTVLGSAGPTVAGALITSDTFAIASRSGLDGSYVSVLRAVESTLTALDLSRSDTGSGRAVPTGAGDEVALDLRLRSEAPYVTSIAPIDGAANVAPTASVAVRFSEAIDPDSVSATVLTVAAGDVLVAGGLTLSEGNTVLTFRPSIGLDNDTEYVVRVTGIRDRAGNAIAAPFTTRFSSIDTNPPPPPAAGLLSASIPDAGFTTFSASQGTAGAHDTVTVVNVTRGTTTPVLLEPNGGFSVRVAAAIGDRLQLVITDRSGNRTVVAAPAFRQANADGSVSTAVTADGGHVEGPGGVAVEVPQGAFPQGTVITLKPVSEAQFPVALTAEQRQVFRYSGGIDIDLGGQRPTTYLNVSVPTTGGETLDDQWIVGQVTHLDGQVFLDAADTARVINGRIRTSSPPCPGVTGSGVYGFLKSARPLGVTYAGIPNANAQLSAQLLVAAIVPMALVPGTLRTPIMMPAVAGGALAMAGAVHAEFLNQSRRVCMPLLSGHVTIAPATVRLALDPSQFEQIEEVIVTNQLTGKQQRFYEPWDDTITVEGSNTDTFMVQGVNWISDIVSLNATVQPRSYVKVAISASVLNVNDTQLLVTNVTNGRTWASGISSSASRPLGDVAALMEGSPGDVYRVDVTDSTGAIRVVAHAVTAYVVGDGNLLVRAAIGTIDPTQAQIDTYNSGKPPEQQIQGSPVVEVLLVRPNGTTETIFDAATSGHDRLAFGAFIYAFDGLISERYGVRVHYANGRTEVIEIPTYQITVRRGTAGTPVRELVGQVPARGESLRIDLGIGGAPATLATEPDGFFHVESRTPIALSFSHPLDPDSVATHMTLKMMGPSGAPIDVAGTWQLSDGGRTVTFNPRSPLQMGKSYQVVMNGVTAGGTPLAVSSLPIKTFAPARLSTLTIPSPIPGFGMQQFGDVEILKHQAASGTALVASTTSLEGFKLHTIDVNNPRAPVKIGQTSGGIPRRLSVVPGLRRPAIDVQYEVPLIGQQTDMSCWAGAAAMIVAFRDQHSVDPLEIAMAGNPTRASSATGYWAAYHQSLSSHRASVEELFRVWGLTGEAIQTLTIDRVRDMLVQYGPLWVGTAEGIGGHVRVVTGIVGDGTPDGTYLLINDPWDQKKDLPESDPAKYKFTMPNSGSQYPELFSDFLIKQENLARRWFGDVKTITEACNQHDDRACELIMNPDNFKLLQACDQNANQQACEALSLPGAQAVFVAHLSTLPSHAIATGPADPGLQLMGGASDPTGPPSPANRINLLAPCTANVSLGPNGNPVFVGDLLATPYYSSFGSGINFFDVTDWTNPCILGGRPLSRNPETLSLGGADNSAHGTLRQYGFARGVTIVPTTAGLEAYVALQELGLMAVNVGADIPSQAPAARQLGPVFPGDYVDVAAHGDNLVALNNNFGGLASLDIVSAGLSPIASVSFDAARAGFSKVHQLVLVRNVGVRRGLPTGQMGTVRMSLAFIAGANGITIIDVTDVENPRRIGLVPTPGIIRTLAVSKDARMLLAGGDGGPSGGTRLFVIDVSDLFTTHLVDGDGDLQDDRILFSAPYLPAVDGDIQGMDYDDARGVAYVTSTRQLDVWAIRRAAFVANNGVPIANAGPAVTVDPDVTVTLDGSRSRDPNGDALTFQWQQVAGPSVTLNASTTDRPTFSTQGLSNVSLSFRLVVRDATAASAPDVVTITVRRSERLVLTPVIAALVVVPGSKTLTATLEDSSGAGTNVSAHADTTYEWVGAGLVSGIDGIPNLTGIINQLSAKLGLPLQLANISVGAGGQVQVQSPGLQLVRATHRAGGRTYRSAVSIVLAGLELDEISLKPESAISTVGGLLGDAVGADRNPPLVLGNAASGFFINTGAVVLEDVTFKFAGSGSIGLAELIDTIEPAIAAALNTLAPGGGTLLTPALMGAFSTLAGVAGTQLLDPIESTEPTVATVVTQAPFKGIVNGLAPGLSAVRGTLDLGPLGSADDSILVWVLPSIDSVRVEPNITAIRETDPPVPGPTVRMQAESTAITAASLPLRGKAQTAAELLDRFLPDGLASWSAGIDKTFVVDAPAPGLRFRIRGSAAPGCSGPDASGNITCAIAFANVGLGFPVPNLLAPLVDASYALGDVSVAQMSAPGLFDVPIIHRGVVGGSSLTGTVSIAGLGSAADPTARVVVGRGPVIVKRPLVPVSAAPPASVIDFTITVTNPFPAPLSGVSVIDTFYLRAPGATSDTVLSTQTFAVGVLQPGETRTLRTSVTVPPGPGTLRNEAASSGSVSSNVIITIDTSAAPPRRPMINEIVFEPQHDWNDDGGNGDGVAFSAVPGSAVPPDPSVNSGDHWFEVLTNSGTVAELTGWTLTFVDAASSTVSMTLSAANLLTRPGSAHVLVLPPSGVSASGVVTLTDTTGAVVDSVDLPAVFAALGAASGSANEAIARVPDGAPGSSLSNFARRPASIGSVNP